MHLRDKRRHLRQRRSRRLDDDIDAFGQGVEVGVRNDHGYLHQFVNLWVQTCHFAVDPDDRILYGFVVVSTHPLTLRRHMVKERIVSRPS